MKQIFSLLFVCCLLFCPLSDALAKGPADKVVTGQAAENMRNVLENLGWIADGKDQGKHLYVFFSTSCIYCRGLFEITRGMTEEAQLRWVPLSRESELDHMYENPDVATLAAAFEGKAAPECRNKESSERTRFYNLGAVQFFLAAQLLTDGPASGFGLPTLLYPSKDGLSVISGLPGDMRSVIKDIRQVEAAKAGFAPAAFGHAGMDVEAVPVADGKYLNEHKQDMPIFLTPFEGAPKMGGVPAGTKQAVPILGVTRSGYALLSLDGKTTAGFIRDKQFVEKTLGAASQ